MVRLLVLSSPFKFLTGEIIHRELISAAKCDIKRAFGTANILASTGKSPDCIHRPGDDLIKCPLKEPKDDCTIDLSEEPIGYYEHGYCRPPCEPELMACPKRTAPMLNTEKRKVCCVIKTSKFKVNPCIKPKCD